MVDTSWSFGEWIEQISSMTIGFYFSIPILLLYILYNRKKVPKAQVGIIFSGFVFYFISVLSGITIDFLFPISDKFSAIISGIITPTILSIIGTIIISKIFILQRKSISDHLIE